MMTNNELVQMILDSILEPSTIKFSPSYLDPAYANNKSRFLPSFSSIPIQRVTYSGNKTIVFFVDGSKCVVTCSPNDNYDRQTAITYALVKRLFGKVDPKTGIVDGAGIGTKLEKIANAGFDQEKEEQELKHKKAQAKAAHEAKQKHEQETAFERKARKLAEELRLKKRAEEILAQDTTLTKTNSKKILNENLEKSQTEYTADDFFKDDTSKDDTSSKNSWMNYVKPNKPFSKFTTSEKRAYWRYHNAKRRASR